MTDSRKKELYTHHFCVERGTTGHSSCRILTQRDGTLRLFFARKQRLFMLALAQRIHIQRLSPECSRALSYIPSIIFSFTLWTLSPPYKITDSL